MSTGKRRYNIKLWKTFTDCFNCLPVAAIVDEKIFCCHGGSLTRTNNTRAVVAAGCLPSTPPSVDLWGPPDAIVICVWLRTAESRLMTSCRDNYVFFESFFLSFEFEGPRSALSNPKVVIWWSQRGRFWQVMSQKMPFLSPKNGDCFWQNRPSPQKIIMLW